MTTPATTKLNAVQELHDYGQSVWLDYIRRSLIDSGELKRFVDEDGLRGMTSNPAIFEKAITGSGDYTAALEELQKDAKLDAKAIFEHLAIRDIQDAADVLRGVYDTSRQTDGFVSLEVSPALARDMQGTIEEARRLWKAVDRPNVMIKVPGTAEGVPAIEQLTSEGININVTLLFSQEAYEQVAGAYMSGLERLVAAGGDPRTVAGVASFFISRIDSLIDSMLEARRKTALTDDEKLAIDKVEGKVAIANAKLTYARFESLYTSARWHKLLEKDAQPQRLLWASTSTKNSKYRDVMYVEELIGTDTVNTMPPATLDAYRAHGKPRYSLVENVPAAQEVMDGLAQAGISMKEVTEKLLADGLELFAEAFEKLLAAVERKSEKAS